MAELGVRHAYGDEMPTIDRYRDEYFERLGRPVQYRDGVSWLVALWDDDIVGCSSYRRLPGLLVMDDLYVEDSRRGRAASGALLRELHTLADMDHLTLFGITAHNGIVEHALARGWQIVGMAMQRAPKELECLL